MRDLVLLAAVIGILPLIWRAPIVGLLAWLWVSLMSPQRDVYGFLANFQLNLVVAAFTVFAWLASNERKAAPINMMTILFVMFGLWTSVTTYFALDPAYSSTEWQLVMKTLLLLLAIVTLVNSKVRVQALVWVIAISLGYYGMKGGGFLLLTGGRNHVYGPDNTMIADNNQLALALIITLPLINYLRVTSKLPITKLACLIVTGFSLLAILGTYSRGALFALLAAGVAFAVRSRTGLVVLLLAGVAIGSLPSVLPASWFDRMATIQSLNEDTSFSGRVEAWQTAVNIAEQRPLVGGGFSATNLDRVAQQFHSPTSADKGRAAHSIYFEVLGDHGFVGLILYLLLVGIAGLNTFRIIAACQGRPDLDWAARLARMIQVSIVAFLVGGAALSMAYYDGFLVILALTASVLQIALHGAEVDARFAGEPRWKQLADASAVALSGFARQLTDRTAARERSTVGQLPGTSAA